MFGWLKRASWGLAAGAILSLSSAASAVMQPNGTVVPVIDPNITTCMDKSVEACIDEAEGNPTAIDTRADALVAPETFQPTCQLTFTPIVKGGTIADVFGWYNVKPDPINPGMFLKPGLAQMYAMFGSPGGFMTGAQLAGQQVVLDLGVEAAAGRYLNGQIGFFLVSGGGVSFNPTTHAIVGNPEFYFFTQHGLNMGSGVNAFYNVLTWESVAHENTFYFGWEDLPSTVGALDNDFDDFVFSVEGVQCGGGGQPCDTGLLGVCAGGILQCKKGVIECVQTIPEGAETCNALDDNCDGAVDEGALCPEGEFCNRGVCVPKCGTGEFRCPATLKCIPEGLCVEEVCVDVVCEAGLVCIGGQCVDSCTGITCPFDRVCRNGGCIDPCIGIECDEGFSCVKGVCSSCACSACGDGMTCHENLCVDTGCETQSCAAGTHCSAGTCVDDCDGVICPDGQLCSEGECVADPNGTGNTPGLGGTTGNPPINLGGATSSGGANSGGRNHDDNKLVPSEPACGCEVPGVASTRGSAALLLLALFGLSRRRRAA